MGADGGEETRNLALGKAGVETAPGGWRLLSDEGPAYRPKGMARFLIGREINHVRNAPYHPLNQGKIECWHRSMNNVVRLEDDYPPSDLEATSTAFAVYCNNARHHEALVKWTPADLYIGREKEAKDRREAIKRRTLEKRRSGHMR